MKKIPFLRPNLVKKESIIPYLSEIEASRIYSNFGPLNTRFEQRVLNEYFDNLGAITTVNNATLGLILAISQCQRPKGKYALMPSFTFSATPLASMWCGLEPFFVDINTDDWSMDEDQLKEVLQLLGDEVAIVIPYATFGTNINLKYYQQIHESGVPVVVDAAASFGVKENQNYFGKGFPGCIVYSFHATKSFGVGEGGAIYSSNKELISKIRQVENFGFSSNRETTSIALNAKMSEYVAAIALSTLDVFQQKSKQDSKSIIGTLMNLIKKIYLIKAGQYKKIMEKYLINLCLFVHLTMKRISILFIHLQTKTLKLGLTSHLRAICIHSLRVFLTQL